MSNRTFLFGFASLLLLAGASLLLPSVRYPLIGWLRGEKLIAGYPASYWNEREGHWERADFDRLALGGSDAVPWLLDVVIRKGGYWDSYRLEASDALVKLGSSARSAAPLLAQTFAELNIDSKPEDYQRKAGDTLLKMGPHAEEAVPYLLPLLRKDRLNTRHQEMVIEIFRAIGTPAKAAVPALLEAVAWRGIDGKAPCKLLADWQVAEAVPALFKALADPDTLGVSDWQIDALVKLYRAGKPVMPVALKALDSGNRNLAFPVTQFLYRLGPDAQPAIEILTKRILEGSTFVSPSCLSILVRIESDEAIQAIVDCMNATGKEVDSLLELHESGKPVMSKAIAGLNNKKKSIRWGCAKLLGRIGPQAKEATAALQKLLQDEDQEVRSVAAEALKKINPSGGQE